MITSSIKTASNSTLRKSTYKNRSSTRVIPNTDIQLANSIKLERPSETSTQSKLVIPTPGNSINCKQIKLLNGTPATCCNETAGVPPVSKVNNDPISRTAYISKNFKFPRFVSNNPTLYTGHLSSRQMWESMQS